MGPWRVMRRGPLRQKKKGLSRAVCSSLGRAAISRQCSRTCFQLPPYDRVFFEETADEAPHRLQIDTLKLLRHGMAKLVKRNTSAAIAQALIETLEYQLLLLWS